MTRPYSEDIRERALARADAGETVRSIAEELQISPSCVTKWKNLRRETGGISPGKIGGHKKRVLSGGQRRLAAQAHSLGAIYLAQVDEGAGCARGQDRRPGGLDFCSCRGTELQKKRFGRPSRIVATSPVSGFAGRPIRAGLTLRAWFLSTRRGSRPTWRRYVAGGQVASVSSQLRPSAIGRP